MSQPLTVVVSLKDIIVDPAKKIDLLSLPKEEANSLIKNSCGFLSSSIDVSIDGEVAVIQFPEEKAAKVDDALKLYQKGVKEAERGEYSKAMKPLPSGFIKLPELSEGHIQRLL